MKQRSKFYWINIGLAIILVLILTLDFSLIVAGSVLLSEEEDEISEDEWNDIAAYVSYEEAMYKLLTIEEVSAQLIGDEYHGEQAEAGYQFYSVKSQIHNAGKVYQEIEYINLYCQGENENDIFIGYEESEDYPLASCNMEIIPSSQTVEVEQVIQVKEGVKKITVFLADEYDPELYQSKDIEL